MFIIFSVRQTAVSSIRGIGIGNAPDHLAALQKISFKSQEDCLG